MFKLLDLDTINKKIDELKIIKPSILENYKMIEISQQLNAEIMITGKYEINGNEITLYCEATDIETNKIVASSEIKNKLDLEIFEIIDKVSDDIINQIPDKKEAKYPEIKKKAQAKIKIKLNNVNKAGNNFIAYRFYLSY